MSQELATRSAVTRVLEVRMAQAQQQERESAAREAAEQARLAELKVRHATTLPKAYDALQAYLKLVLKSIEQNDFSAHDAVITVRFVDYISTTWFLKRELYVFETVKDVCWPLGRDGYRRDLFLRSDGTVWQKENDTKDKPVYVSASPITLGEIVKLYEFLTDKRKNLRVSKAITKVMTEAQSLMFTTPRDFTMPTLASLNQPPHV